MEELTPINEIRQQVEQRELDKPNIANDIVETQYQKDKEELVNDEKFQETSKNIVTKSAEIKMQEDLLNLLNQKQKNDLAQYALECEKSKLEYRKKKEKDVILADVKAEIANKKIETLWKRYGYMYKDRKDFIPNKSYNRQKEIANWWNGTSDNFKKVVRGTFKFVFWAGFISLAVILGYRVFSWIVENTKNLPPLN